MKPQKQAIARSTNGEFGDCHRTCIAMVLNMDRDEVPHFMADAPPGLEADDPLYMAAELAEIEWLKQFGLAPVNIPFEGSTSLDTLMTMLAALTHGAPVLLGCSSKRGNHSVVLYEGVIYNPNDGVVVGPMADGFWWLTIYSVGGNWGQ